MVGGTWYVVVGLNNGPHRNLHTNQPRTGSPARFRMFIFEMRRRMNTYVATLKPKISRHYRLATLITTVLLLDRGFLQTVDTSY